MSAARIPITVLTGFSGAGKTTLLRYMLSAREARNSVVIVNELGAVSLDHLLVQHVREELVPAPGSGGGCRLVRADLSDALWTARWRAELSGMKVDRIFLETTGLADPVPVLRTLVTDPYIQSHYRLAGVVTVVDALAGGRTVERHEEALKQVTAADLLVITKGDLAKSSRQLEQLHEQLRRVNPLAARIEAEQGLLEIGALLGLERRDLAVSIPDVGAPANRAVVERASASPAPRRAAPFLRLAFPRAPTRDGTVRAFSVVRDEPLEERVLEAWLAELFESLRAGLLRMKGVVHIRGQKSPRLVHSVQHFLHEPIVLPAWPSGDRRTRLVFVTRGVEPHTIEQSLDACCGGRHAGPRVWPATADSC